MALSVKDDEKENRIKELAGLKASLDLDTENPNPQYYAIYDSYINCEIDFAEFKRRFFKLSLQEANMITDKANPNTVLSLSQQDAAAMMGLK